MQLVKLAEPRSVDRWFKCVTYESVLLVPRRECAVSLDLCYLFIGPVRLRLMGYWAITKYLTNAHLLASRPASNKLPHLLAPHSSIDKCRINSCM
jgi:hypothetical protein